MNRRLKVVLISGSWPPIHCGVGDYTFHLVEHLEKQGVDVRVLTSSPASKSKKVANIVQDWTRNDLEKIRSYVRKLQPDVIHMEYPSVMYKRHVFPSRLPGLLKKAFPDIPVIITLHEYRDASRLGRLRARLTTLGADEVILTNTSDKLDLKNFLSRRSYRVIPIGSNIEVVKPTAKQSETILHKYKIQKGAYWLNLGFVDPSKGVDNLITAIQQQVKPLPLVIATEYNSNNQYHRTVMSRVKTSRVPIIWTGYLSEKDISLLLQKSFGVVLPFDQPATERRGSLIAALSHAKACVTSGDEEASPFSGSTLLLKHNSPEVIAGAMNRLVADSSLKARLEKSASINSSLYDWDNIARLHQTIYQEIIGE